MDTKPNKNLTPEDILYPDGLKPDDIDRLVEETDLFRSRIAKTGALDPSGELTEMAGEDLAGSRFA